MVKGKKIDDPLREGQVAKIYFAAFQKPETGYMLAKKVFGTETYVRKTASGEEKESEKARKSNKPYEIAKRYNELFDRPEEEGKNKIFSKVEPFLKKLEANLKKDNIKLTKEERKQLKEYLDGPFRKATRGKYLKIDYSKEVDAWSELLGLLMAITGIEYSVRLSVNFSRLLPSSDSEKKVKEVMYDTWRNKAPEELGLSPLPLSNDEIFNPVKNFSESLLEKLDKAELEGSREVLRKHSKLVIGAKNKLLMEMKKYSR